MRTISRHVSNEIFPQLLNNYDSVSIGLLFQHRNTDLSRDEPVVNRKTNVLLIASQILSHEATAHQPSAKGQPPMSDEMSRACSFSISPIPLPSAARGHSPA